MRIVKEYQRREFCRDWGCPSQRKLDTAPDQDAAEAIKKEACFGCMAHVFHKWLSDRHYQIVVLE